MVTSFSDAVKKKVNKSDKAKGHKKSRRWNRPRSDKAKRLCAERKAARRNAQAASEKRNAETRSAGLLTPWEISKANRYAARHKNARTEQRA